MDDYNLTDALHAVIAQISQPEFLLTLAITVAVLALLVVFTPRPPMTGSDEALELCRVETHHRIDRAPRSPLRRGFFQKLPGLYSQRVCRCGLRERQRWVGTSSSARAVRLRNAGLL